MRRVPRLSMPEDMPEGPDRHRRHRQQAAHRILRRLAWHPLTTLELADQLGVHPASVHRHLVLLEDHGLVTADIARGRRQGQTVTWHTNRDNVAEVGRLLIDYASGC